MGDLVDPIKKVRSYIRRAFKNEAINIVKLVAVMRNYKCCMLDSNLYIYLRILVKKFEDDKKKCKYKYQTNKRALLAKVKQCFVKLFYDTQTLIDTMENIIKTVAMESVPIRLGRKYPRGKTFRAYVPVI